MADGRLVFTEGQDSGYGIRNGTVQVREGKIIVTDPDIGGEMARISPGTNVKLFVDGAEVTHFTAVSESSRIEVAIQNKDPERKFDISVDNKKMSAAIKVNYTDGIKYCLKNYPPTGELVIGTMSAGTIKCPRFTMDEAMEMLRKNGIVYGIQEERLKNAIVSGNGEPEIVARGLMPVDGEDDRIEPRFHEEKKYVEVNGRIDFYSIGKVLSVESGAIVAEKIPGNDGIPGMDVMGNKIPPKPGKKVNIVPGAGVELSADGFKAYSRIRGRPDIKGNTVSVHEVYEVASDVDITTGNIEFTGDIVVKGNITDGMKAHAGNCLFLNGSITNGCIEAGSNITVQKNVISSQIRAGCIDFTRYNIIDRFNEIQKSMQSMFYAVDMLKDTEKIPKTYKDGKIIKLLLDTKFSSITKSIAELRSLLFENRKLLDMGVLELGAKLVKYFTGNGALLIETYLEIKMLIDEITDKVEYLKNSLSSPSHIYVNYVQNSTLTTSGNIIITGKGCFNSDLNCRGGVVFEKPGSVMRGGSISACEDIKINELGSPGGAYTVVSTGENAVITCEIAYINSVIKIGTLSSKLDSSVRKLKAYIFKGELIIESLKL